MTDDEEDAIDADEEHDGAAHADMRAEQQEALKSALAETDQLMDSNRPEPEEEAGFEDDQESNPDTPEPDSKTLQTEDERTTSPTKEEPEAGETPEYLSDAFREVLTGLVHLARSQRDEINGLTRTVERLQSDVEALRQAARESNTPPAPEADELTDRILEMLDKQASRPAGQDKASDQDQDQKDSDQAPDEKTSGGDDKEASKSEKDQEIKEDKPKSDSQDKAEAETVKDSETTPAEEQPRRRKWYLLFLR